MNSRTNTTPQILPWLAKKAGIDMSRATVLWRAAERQAARGASPETPEYFKLAVDRLLAMVAEETIRADAASFGWRPMVRAQWRLWDAMMGTVDSAQLIASRGARMAHLLTARV